MKKAVKDLRPGDILPGMVTRVVLRVILGMASGVVTIYSTPFGEPDSQPMPPQHFTEGESIEVEPRVTPKELDQLLEIARAYVANVSASITERNLAQDLVNKLSPPNPPTYEELLDVVRRMCEPPRAYAEGQATPFSDCAKLAERARNAGLLK